MPDAPIASLLSCMPNLRILVLELTQVGNMDERVVWPRGDTGPFPCPNLEHLTLANPLPHDDLWAHLPRTIHTLSLCSCPPYTHRGWHARHTPGVYHTPQYKFPLLSATELLSILQRCQTPYVKTLEIEYRADHSEPALLQYVASSYPDMATLQVRRYRANARGSIVVGRHETDSSRSR